MQLYIYWKWDTCPYAECRQNKKLHNIRQTCRKVCNFNVVMREVKAVMKFIKAIKKNLNNLLGNLTHSAHISVKIQCSIMANILTVLSNTPLHVINIRMELLILWTCHSLR